MNELNDIVQSDVMLALHDYMAGSERTIQSNEGILGPSDIGFCRQKAVLVTRQVKPTDSTSKWAASVGTAMHDYIEAAMREAHPDWIFGSIDHLQTVAELPSGAQIKGHPDIVAPDLNAVLDIKTVNGFEWTRRNGPSTSHKYQRHLYALGLMQNEILDASKEVLVGNVYFDRSGSDDTPLVFIEPFDFGLTAEIDSWVNDVIYAVKNGEDSARDVPAAVCERICEFFTVCRGGLEDNSSDGIIDDSELISAVDMYVEGRDLENSGKRLKKEASERLSGVSGATPTHQVRWVTVNPSTVESYERPGYERLDIRKKR